MKINDSKVDIHDIITKEKVEVFLFYFYFITCCVERIKTKKFIFKISQNRINHAPNIKLIKSYTLVI